MSLMLVRAMRWEADGVLSLLLVDPAGAELPDWAPGAHIDLAPVDGSAPERQYSLCSDPAERYSWRVAVLREPESRGGSAWVHERLRPGDLVEVTGPRNHFQLEDDSARYLLIAGGIGITPLLAMARHLDARGADWRLVYGGRRGAAMAFRDELAAFGDRVVVRPGDQYGRLPLAELLSGEEPRPTVYCCGPEPLLAAVEARCADARYVVRVERFSAVVAAPSEGALDTFEVEVASTGEVLKVLPGVSILDVLEAAGIELDRSCLEGVCGSCETGVLAGEPEHRDAILTDAEKSRGRTMMVCVGGARTPRLVLDL